MEIPGSCAVGINEMLETNTIIKKETREFARPYTLKQFCPWSHLAVLPRDPGQYVTLSATDNSSIVVLVMNTKV